MRREFKELRNHDLFNTLFFALPLVGGPIELLRFSEVFKFLVHSVEGEVAQERVPLFLTYSGMSWRLVEHHTCISFHIPLRIEVASTTSKQPDVHIPLLPCRHYKPV